jgi:hypothetical protein
MIEGHTLPTSGRLKLHCSCTMVPSESTKNLPLSSFVSHFFFRICFHQGTLCESTLPPLRRRWTFVFLFKVCGVSHRRLVTSVRTRRSTRGRPNLSRRSFFTLKDECISQDQSFARELDGSKIIRWVSIPALLITDVASNRWWMIYRRWLWAEELKTMRLPSKPREWPFR